MKKTKTLFFIIMLMCSINATNAQSLAQQLRQRFEIICIDKDILVDQPIPSLDDKPIPVGCEVIDCCPYCPGPYPLDLEIEWKAEEGVSLVIKFEKADAKTMEKIQITGEAKWMTKNELIISGSKVNLKGVPTRTMLFPEMQLNKNAADKLMKDADSDTDGKIRKNYAQAKIRQWKDKYIVNDYSVSFGAKTCWFVNPTRHEDKIVLNNNTGNDNAVILFDANRSGCENDVIFRTTNEIHIGNALSNGACNVETCVFSDDNAFAIISPSTEWTNIAGDVQTFNLVPRLTIPVTVWIIDAAALARAQADINRANLLYNTQHVGVFLDAIFTDVSGNNNATNLLLTMRCEDNANIRASNFFTNGRLNVYYADDVLLGGGGTARGRSCFLSNNEDIVGVSNTADNESLAHEVGHSLTLRHPDDDGVVYDSPTNLMISGGVNRDNITEGQSFRVNTNISEDGHQNVLVRLGIIAGSRNCEENDIAPRCPDVTLDITPN